MNENLGSTSNLSDAALVSDAVQTPAMLGLSQRIASARSVVQTSLVAYSACLGLYIVLAFVVSDFPMGLLTIGVASVAVTVFCLWLIRLQKYEWAIRIYLISISVFLFGSMYFTRGTRGPISLVIPLVSLVASTMANRNTAIAISAFNITFYIVALVLEVYVGVVIPYPMPEFIMPIFWAGCLGAVIVVLVVLNERAKGAMYKLFASQEERERELTTATQRAEAAVAAERELRQGEITGKQRLDAALGQYVSFLEQVRVGDYETRLDMTALATDRKLPLALLNLGRYLNATVESLVDALTEVQAVQQAYVQQAWAKLSALETTPMGYYCLRDGAVDVSKSVWLAPMTQALQTRDSIILDGALALPLEIRGQIIGALGVLRARGEAWSTEELEIVTAVVDQLAQTIENLRLVDDTNRRAAREQSIAKVTARIRTEMEIEAVLERALVELGEVLHAERGAAHLALGED